MQDIDAVDLARADLALAELDDSALLTMARAGHQDAYATLFSRYSYAAHRLARHLGQKEDSDDVVSEAFAQVLDLLGRGRGPDTAFRAYLFTTVRHECARRAKARQRVTPTDDLRRIDSAVEFGNGELDDFERTAIRAAYESLPPRWRTVLWHLDVEGRKPQELSPLLDMSPNSVSALVYRARSGLRQAYLQHHVKQEQPTDSRACTKYRSKLAGLVRRTISTRDQERVHAHLESCEACMAIYLDLQEVNQDVGTIDVRTAAVASAAGVAAVSLLTQPVLFAKGVAATLAAPMAAVAFASTTLVGVPSASLAESPGATITESAEVGQAATAAAPEAIRRPVQSTSPQVRREAVASAVQVAPTASAAPEPSRTSSPTVAPDAAAEIPSIAAVPDVVPQAGALLSGVVDVPKVVEVAGVAVQRVLESASAPIDLTSLSGQSSTP